MAELEYRSCDLMETRTDDSVPGFTGYAATLWAVDSYRTAFAPKAFRKSIAERGERLPVLAFHEPSKPIGRHRSIREDKTGLAVDVELIDDGADGTVMLKRLRGGVPLGMSFGFQTLRDRSAADDDPIDLSQMPSGTKAADIRIITEVKLWETSVVTFPANEAATITAVRHEREQDALSSLIESTRAGTLTDEQRAQIEALVAAWQDRADAGLPESTSPDPDAQRNRDIAIALTTAKAWGYLTGAITL